MKKTLACLSPIILSLMMGCKPTPDYEKVGYAPPDAFESGSEFPYYGSFTKKGFIETEFTEKTLYLYKRRGQYQILNIVRGRPEQAAEYCRALLAENADDPEFWFTLSVAQTQLNDIDNALSSMERALSNGLPFERYLAGPRDLLRPLTQTGAFQKLASDHDIVLVHGPLLGCVTDTSAKFWVRTAREMTVQVSVSRSRDLSDSISSMVTYSEQKADYTALAEIGGLQPSTAYYYEVLIDGRPTLERPFPSFITNPPKGESSRFKVAFGGGAGYVPWHEHVWQVIGDHNPAALLLMGDNVYHDMPESLHAGHAYTYYRRQSRPEFRRLTSSSSVYAIWDDHDCATNDVFMGPYRDRPSWKPEMFTLFQRNWNNPAYGDQEWPGVWFDFSIGDVDFFMLDGRFYRTNPHSDDPTMLGPVQKKWLLGRLEASTSTFKVIASPVPWSFESKGDSLDTWNGYRQERAEIFDFLSDHHIDGVILLSADRHRSDAWRIARPSGYALYEFESSRLTNEHVHPVMDGSLFGYNEKQSFGLLTFDTTLPDPTVTYQIYNIDGELINTFELKRSEISHQPKVAVDTSTVP
jgi:alkaline phosphatase D